MLSLLSAAVLALLMLPWLFVNTSWAYWVAVSVGGMFVLLAALGLVQLCVSILSERWLADTAAKYKTPDDWETLLQSMRGSEGEPR